MVVLPLATDFMEQRWRASGKRQFQYVWTLENFNDLQIQVAIPNSLLTNSIGCTITFTDLIITYIGAVNTPITNIFSQWTGLHYFPNWTTATTTDTMSYQNLNWIVLNDRSQMPPQSVLLTLYSLAMLATDDILIEFRGYIERELLEGVQPVSLEGYKWPLTKRSV